MNNVLHWEMMSLNDMFRLLFWTLMGFKSSPTPGKCKAGTNLAELAVLI